ncbi:sulfite exporter TauE/SafE family protein [Gottfriedia acidiceleris]|uniref:sulfite exporter TauE/SafE family protein n=1 Tax=Gottfriedia acidiceleris TaxID=371036 RepID=UPI00101DF03C|nr:sulfite exporter TauE/SafE family protein [Gottfriedia acidiceleris]
MLQILILISIGLAAGTVGSLIGLGGGIIIVPMLLNIDHFLSAFTTVPIHVAVGTSLITIVFSSLSSTLSYHKQKRIDYKSGILFLIGSVPGSLLGTYINSLLNTERFTLFFGIFLICISVFLLVSSKLNKKIKEVHKGIIRIYTNDEGEAYTYSYSLPLAISLSICIGIISGLFGIGGGILLVPMMAFLFGFPPQLAVATSMFVVMFTTLGSSISYIALGEVNFYYILLLIPGAWFGGKIGAYINQKLKTETIALILRLVVLFYGIKLIIENI